MIAALGHAFGEIFEPRVRRTLVLSLLIAATILGALVACGGWFVHANGFVAHLPFGSALAVLGDVALLGLAWILFPVVATTVIGFFVEDALRAVEARRYPSLGPPREQPFSEQLRAGIRLGLLGLCLNLLALPLYLLLPGLNLVIFYGLNGWLLGREYFEMIAVRRVDGVALRGLWRHHWPRLVAAGAVIAFLLTVPVVNLAAPLIGALFMLHVFERLRRAAASDRNLALGH